MRTQSPSVPKLLYRTVQVRANDAGDGFAGHAATFWAVDAYGTALKPGAFTRSLNARGDRVPVLWQHRTDQPIGKPTELSEDETGLAFDAKVVTETRAGAEAMALLRDGVPLGMSFGFEAIRSRPVEDDDYPKLTWDSAPEFYKSEEGRQYVRINEEVKLWELSLVTFPANEAATITDVRHATTLDLLTTLLADLRAGTLDEASQRMVTELVAASTAAAQAAPGSDGGETPSAPPTATTRQHITELLTLQLEELTA